MITYVREEQLEEIARKVWYMRRDKASRVNGNEKHANFKQVGLQGNSTQFPMRSGEWVRTGKLEISISYPKWDIPAIVRVRKYADQ